MHLPSASRQPCSRCMRRRRRLTAPHCSFNVRGLRSGTRVPSQPAVNIAPSEGDPGLEGPGFPMSGSRASPMSASGTSSEPAVSRSAPVDAGTELAMRRTGMSFQRTRMAADRTLMAVIRTSLSLIGFGFTIFQFFSKLKGSNLVPAESSAPRNFGMALVWLGILMLVTGIAYQVQFMAGLRAERRAMKAGGLIHAESRFPVSMTLLTAVVLLMIGIAAIVSMTFQIGPFD